MLLKRAIIFIQRENLHDNWLRGGGGAWGDGGMGGWGDGGMGGQAPSTRPLLLLRAGKAGTLDRGFTVRKKSYFSPMTNNWGNED